MSDEILIPENWRTVEFIKTPAQIDTLEELDAALIALVDEHSDRIPGVKLVILSRMYTQTAKKLRTSVKERVEELCRQGKLALRFFVPLGGQYVFTAENWILLMRLADSGLDPIMEFIKIVQRDKSSESLTVDKSSTDSIT